ncbi:GNAT family N-acetyltransferase [Shewanella profunda]|uniref:GNAT family N-acetyltransferase n=1 Tax=Shewanella profunda TaxID=254793 RepID=UPI00200CFC83|nr:GNAT family N-acetyltransferase [Shewanella profunda]MCL1091195.1 GNAT family N-acetyltransferase [Shewanella profunda]
MGDSAQTDPEMHSVTTQSVNLRAIEISDLEVFFSHQSDPIAHQLAQFPPREREAFFTHWQQNILYNKQVLSRAIMVNGVLVGNIVSFQYNGQSLVGYWIGREYWGKGIATQALKVFLPLTSARPLFAHVAKHNHASLRVLLRQGFVLTGKQIKESEDTQALIELKLS